LNQTPSDAIGKTVMNNLPEFAGNALGSGNVGGLIGAGVGTTMAQNATEQDIQGNIPIAPWSPTRASGYSMPSNLGYMGGMNPQQQTSGIATQGIYGGGAGQDENQYFLNLINNRLMDTGGNNTGDLSPIEQSYLQKLGLGGYQDENELLRNMESYA
jgi:hypothetical protein